MGIKKGTWKQALAGLLLPVLCLLIIRWQFFEPYVIPSASMEPTLLGHDYILVNKFAYGIRLPLTDRWLTRTMPARGEIVVFRSPHDPETFFIKRVVGVAGDEIEFKQGRLYLNGQLVTQDLTDLNGQRKWLETLDTHVYEIHTDEENSLPFGPVVVPAGNLFVMGDNRAHSSDSRAWGFLDVHALLGRATLIWLSCATDEIAITLCTPENLRKDRLFKAIR